MEHATTNDSGNGEERIFQCTTDGAHKFWRVRVQENVQTVWFGRIGTAGQIQTKTFDDPATARATTERLIAQKLAKGYVAVTAQVASATPPRPRRANTQLLFDFDELCAEPAFPVGMPAAAPPQPPALSLDL